MSSVEPRITVVTCMDARLDAAGYLDCWPEPVHIVRNAGGRVTFDVLRSLAVSCTMQIDRILVIHHTQCAMAASSEDELRELLPATADRSIDLLTIADPLKALRDDVLAVRSSPLIPAETQVSGLVYDLDSRHAHELDAAVLDSDR